MANQYSRVDHTGETFGELTLIAYLGKGRYRCKCSCGVYKDVNYSDMRKGRVKSCGHIKRGKQLDIVGKKFNHLTVLERVGQGKGGRFLFLCRCDCGVEKVLEGRQVKSGKVKSCGRHGREAVSKANTAHGDTGTRLYDIYRSMIKRCYNENSPAYPHYGGRGVEVCDGWRGDKGYENFKNWALHNGYRDDLTIDRIDVNGNYEPCNCRWASTKQQARNRTDTFYVTVNGVTKPLIDWCEELGLKYSSVWRRIKVYGYPPEKALFYRADRVAK